MHLQNKGRLKSLFEGSLELASSTRPQDCTTAAYLLRLLLTQPLLQEITQEVLQDLTKGAGDARNITQTGTYQLCKISCVK